MKIKCTTLHLHLLCFIVVAALRIRNVGASSRELRYALFISGPDSAFDSSGSVPAIELAEEKIANHPFLLKEYSLNHTQVLDTLCDRTRSLDQFFATVAQADPPVLGLLGCGCSVASEPVAEIIHHWNISQIAYSSSAITLSNRQKFVNFFRTYPSDVSFGPAMVSLLQYYGWNQIVIITEEQNLFTATLGSLTSLMKTNNITVRNRMVSKPVPKLQSSLKVLDSDFFFSNEDIRVIFINSYSALARIVLCEAMRTHGLSGYPRYVWITYAWYQDQWWTSAVNDDPIRCSDNELSQLLIQSIAIEIVPFPGNSEAETDVGLTANEFNRQYKMRLNTPAALENNYTFTFVAPLAYDAVWSLALALNATDGMLNWPKERIIKRTSCQDDGTELTGFRLDDFTYNNSFVGCVIRWNLAQTNFVGVSGRVNFINNGSRQLSKIALLQYKKTCNGTSISTETFANINSLNDFTLEYLNNQNNNTVFPGNVPSDGTPEEIVLTYHLSLVVIFDLFAFIGLIFTTACLIFNFVYRRRKIVRLTSPNLNYFIIAGSYIMNVSIFVRLLPSTDETVNYVRCNVLLNTLGYCLAFGTILVKMGRIFHIFTNPVKNKKRALKDWHLAIIVLCISGVGVLMAVLGWSIPQLRANPMLQMDEERGFGQNELGIRIVYKVWQCTAGNNSNIVNIVIFVYLAILQIIAVVMAIKTRKVKIKALNDSKYIVALIYVSSVTLVITATVTLALGALINVTELFFTGSLFIATTAFVCLTFIPKMVSLYRDPLGEKIFSEHNDASLTGGALCTGNILDGQPSEMETRIKELENLLRESRDKECRCANTRSTSNFIFADNIGPVDSHKACSTEIKHNMGQRNNNTERNGEQENGGEGHRYYMYQSQHL